MWHKVKSKFFCGRKVTFFATGLKKPTNKYGSESWMTSQKTRDWGEHVRDCCESTLGHAFYFKNCKQRPNPFSLKFRSRPILLKQNQIVQTMSLFKTAAAFGRASLVRLPLARASPSGKIPAVSLTASTLRAHAAAPLASTPSWRSMSSRSKF